MCWRIYSNRYKGCGGVGEIRRGGGKKAGRGTKGIG
jgi:hypothetical protein